MQAADLVRSAIKISAPASLLPPIIWAPFMTIHMTHKIWRYWKSPHSAALQLLE